MFGAPLLACHHCGTLHERVPLEPGAVANCVRCESVLYRQSRLQLNGWIALVLCALIVFAIANYFPIATLSIQGITVQASLPGALFLTWQQGREVLAIMTGLFGFWLPLTQLLFVLWALLAIRSGRLPPDFRYAMRLLRLIMPWSMVPVLMLGILVAIVKFASLASIEAGMAIWAFGVLTLLLTGLSRLTAHRLWHYAEDAGLVVTAATGAARHGVVASCGACGLVQGLDNKHALAHCPRCGAGVHCRKPNQNARVWALVVTACILYIPANVLPVMRVRTAASDGMHTILGGVVEFWKLGSWDLALIVFVASVVIPITKLLALIVLLTHRSWRGVAVQRQRTRLYEMVEFIGQWSMLDVFVVILLTAMANFPGISQIVAEPGAVSFGLVVVFTMLAAMSYDPRSGWDHQPDHDTIPARQPVAGTVQTSQAV